MVIKDVTFSVNNYQSVIPNYVTESIINIIDPLEVVEPQQIAKEVIDNITQNISTRARNLYKVIDYFAIKRFFDSSGASFGGEPAYDQSYNSVDNILLRDIFVNQSYTVADFATLVYDSKSNPLADDYEVYVELYEFLSTIFEITGAYTIIPQFLSDETRAQILIDNTGSTISLYDFFINEINYVLEQTQEIIAGIQEEYPNATLTFDATTLSLNEQLYSLLNFLNLVPTLISDKEALQAQIDALEARLDFVIGQTLTASSMVTLQVEAETDFEFIYAIYVRVYGTPYNGVFDAQKVNFLRQLSPDQLYTLLQTTL